MTRIAVAINKDDENTYEHFGHAERFKLFDISEGRIEAVDYLTVDEDHGGAKLQAMIQNFVNMIISDGMGPGVYDKCSLLGIEICAGFKGSADEAVSRFLDGTLESDPEAVRPCGGHGCH